MSYQDDVRGRSRGDYGSKTISKSRKKEEEEPKRKTILDDKVMKYINKNYEQIGVPPPILYRDKTDYIVWDDDTIEPIELDFIEYYTRFDNETPPMWLRIILRYFDQNEIPEDVMEYLHSSLQEESSFWRFMSGVAKHSKPGLWHPFFPEILKLLKKFGLKTPKDGAMIELMKEIIQ